MNIRYTLQSLCRLDIRNRLQDVTAVAKRSGKNALAVLVDMVYCGLRYGAGPVDYRLFEFYNKTPAQRATYITRGINNELVRRFNQADCWHYFDNKSHQNEKFGGFLGRDWLPTDTMTLEQFTLFCQGKTSFLYKPNSGSCGKGIRKFDLTSLSRDASFRLLKGLPAGVIEEIICQHPDLMRVYPNAVNTVRVVTICKDGVCTPLCAFWRMGNGENYVDNLNSGGISAKLDITSGTVTLPAASKDGTLYEIHPVTGENIVGFRIPHWQKVLSLVEAAAKVVPQVGYVGWDVAVRQDDAVLVEGNCYPGHDILQLPAYTPNGEGLLNTVTPFLAEK